MDSNPALDRLSQRRALAEKISKLLQRRVGIAQSHFEQRVRDAYETTIKDLQSRPTTPWQIWADGARYAVDFAQRSVLFWDTLRQRGNDFVERTHAGLPPV